MKKEKKKQKQKVYKIFTKRKERYVFFNKVLLVY